MEGASTDLGHILKKSILPMTLIQTTIHTEVLSHPKSKVLFSIDENPFSHEEEKKQRPERKMSIMRVATVVRRAL